LAAREHVLANQRVAEKETPTGLISMARNCRQAKDLHSTSYVKIKDSVVRNAECGRQKAEGGKQKAEGGKRSAE
jgi:hypothetical protein